MLTEFKQMTVADLLDALLDVPESQQHLRVRVEGYCSMEDAFGVEIKEYNGERVLIIVNAGHGPE